jgi:hypothetical protein
MSDTKYLPDLVDKDPREDILPDFEVVRLRQENASLRKQLEAAQQVLVENGLDEVGPKPVEPAELICIKQIGLLQQLSDKGLPFATEDIKNLEVLVKTLLAIRGKAPVESESASKKKKPEAKIADLLSIVKNTPKAE